MGTPVPPQHTHMLLQTHAPYGELNRRPDAIPVLWEMMVLPFMQTLWQFRELVRYIRHDAEADEGVGDVPAGRVLTLRDIKRGYLVEDDDEGELGLAAALVSDY